MYQKNSSGDEEFDSDKYNLMGIRLFVAHSFSIKLRKLVFPVPLPPHINKCLI